MKITKISLKDFRAFKGESVIDLKDGHNLLLYGENGSGKSSLYQALNLFFAPSTPFGDHKNIFVTTNDGFVSLEIGDGTNPSTIYEWEANTHPCTEILIVETSKTKGFLDYRSLLETHFTHRHEDNVNVFNLLITNLLANLQNPISKQLFKEEWDFIYLLARGRKGKWRTESINSRLYNFNAGLTMIMTDLTTIANKILNNFEHSIKIELSLAEHGLRFMPEHKYIADQIIELTADYYSQSVPHHHRFLNEARLSAIALSIYLAALLLNPPSQLRVLFLDDVLIGLDMSNRLPLLDILQQFFSDWQIILATYDKVWFDMVWQRVKDLGKWEQGELYCCKNGQCDVPIYKGNNTEYLAVARRHLDQNDFKATAIYIRSAFESILANFCNKHSLLVRFRMNPKDQKSDDFWQVVKKQKLRTGGDLIDATLVHDIELFRATILNQLSHTAQVNLVRSEVESAFDVVKSLEQRFNRVPHRGLHRQQT